MAKKEEIAAAVQAPEAPVVVAGGLKKIKVTKDELMQLQKDGLLVGYEPATNMALVKG